MANYKTRIEAEYEAIEQVFEAFRRQISKVLSND
jgi:hypothetical protein